MRRFSVAFLILWALTSSVAAHAHAFLVSANPAVGGTVSTVISAVTITYTESLEPHFSSLTVQDAAGVRVDLGDAHTDADNAARYTVGLKTLKPGVYKVIWHATSVDTHKTNGSYTFTVER